MVDVKADLSSLGSQSFCWFCHEAALIMNDAIVKKKTEVEVHEYFGSYSK